MKRTFLALAWATLVMTGCAGGPSFKEVQSSFPALSAGSGRLYFYRDSALAVGAHTPEIRLDGEMVGTLPGASFFYVDRPAGRHLVTASIDTERRLSLGLAAGETKYVRTSIRHGFAVRNIVLELRPPPEGAADLASLTYIGGAAK